jgi:hypothetical protein
MAPEFCPQCGAEVPRRARACPECGSDETTGWSDDAATGDLGLPEPEFDYRRFVSEEFGADRKAGHLHWVWCAVAAGLLLVFLRLFLGRLP